MLKLIHCTEKQIKVISQSEHLTDTQGEPQLNLAS